MSENSPGLPPSPEGHFAAGSLFLSLALRVAGTLMCPTNEREKDRERAAEKAAGRISLRFRFKMSICCLKLNSVLYRLWRSTNDLFRVTKQQNMLCRCRCW